MHPEFFGMLISGKRGVELKNNINNNYKERS